MGKPISDLSQAGWKMFTTRQRIKKTKGEPTELENQVAQAFVDLEINNEELRPYLKNLHIAGAKEVVVNKSTAAIVIFLPYRLKDLFRKNQVRLVRELEKKFSGQHVVLVATRNIQDKESRQSRTFTAVHEAILSDLVFPANISGKRTRHSLDGTKQIKVSLDNPYEVSDKLATFAAVYTSLTGKHAVFELPVQEE